MEESSFVGVFESIAKEVVGAKVVIKRKANLIYQLNLDRHLEVNIKNTKSPKRGSSAFQTDLCICEMIDNVEFPRVVIEFKTKVTTHDVLSYSVKAGKHKSVYPCLRYGVLASDMGRVPGRFFVHNEHLDFFIAAANYISKEALRSFATKLIQKEIEISRMLEKIHFDDCEFDYYRKDIVFGDFNGS